MLPIEKEVDQNANCIMLWDDLLSDGSQWIKIFMMKLTNLGLKMEGK